MFLTVSELYILDLNHWTRKLRNLTKFELDGILLWPLDELSSLSGFLTARDGSILFLLAPSPGFPALARLDLFGGLGPAAPALFELSEFPLLLLPGLHELLHALRLHGLVGVVVTLVRNELKIVKRQNFLTDAVEKVLVVTHNQQRLFPFLEIVV